MENEEQPQQEPKAAESTKEERIEAYFTTDNEHWNHCAYLLYEKIKLWNDPPAFLDLYRQSLDLVETNVNNGSLALFRLDKLLASIKGEWGGTYKNWLREFIIYYFNRVYNGTPETERYKTISSLFERQINEYRFYERVLPTSHWSDRVAINITVSNSGTYDWSETKAHLETLPDSTAKIKYLIEQRAEYKQTFDGLDITFGPSYADQCQTEIKKLKDLAELEKLGQSAKSPFKLSGKSGAKINLIRLLNALYELNLIELENGLRPTKEQFMQQIGGFMGVDAKDYSKDLEQALNMSIEANVKVFDELKRKITEQVLVKQKL